jgi:hypothetical protein
MWFQIWSADAGWFPDFREMGWFVGTREQAAELLALLLAAGLGASKVFIVADESGVPVLPAPSTPVGPTSGGGQDPWPIPGGGQVPWLPGAQPGAAPWWNFLTY